MNSSRKMIESSPSDDAPGAIEEQGSRSNHPRWISGGSGMGRPPKSLSSTIRRRRSRQLKDEALIAALEFGNLRGFGWLRLKLSAGLAIGTIARHRPTWRSAIPVGWCRASRPRGEARHVLSITHLLIDDVQEHLTGREAAEV